MAPNMNDVYIERPEAAPVKGAMGALLFPGLAMPGAPVGADA